MCNNFTSLTHFPFTQQLLNGKREALLWEVVIKMTLLICDGVVDFAPTFVGVKLWCVYHILQYACLNCKAIWVKGKQ